MGVSPYLDPVVLRHAQELMAYERAVLELSAIYRRDVRVSFAHYVATDANDWKECHDHLRRRGLLGLAWPEEAN